jgi:hypothetical protein
VPLRTRIRYYSPMSDLNDAFVVDDEDVWISGPHRNDPLAQSLKELDFSLRCPICREFCHMPVLVQLCGHAFCAECIRSAFQAGRQSLLRKASCPVCRVVVDSKGRDWENCLVANPALEKTIHVFKSLRGDLLKKLQDNKLSPSDVAAVIGSSNIGEIAAKQSANSISPSTGTIVASNCAQHRPPKRQIPYSLLKKKQLQAHCAQEGLSTHGTEQELIERHRQFVSLYNASSQSLKPLTSEECAAEIHRREAALAKTQDRQAQRDASALHQVVQQLNLGKSVVKSGNAQFDAKLKDGYAKLIARAKAQKNLQKRNDNVESSVASDKDQNNKVTTDEHSESKTKDVAQLEAASNIHATAVEKMNILKETRYPSRRKATATSTVSSKDKTDIAEGSLEHTIVTTKDPTLRSSLARNDDTNVSTTMVSSNGRPADMLDAAVTSTASSVSPATSEEGPICHEPAVTKSHPHRRRRRISAPPGSSNNEGSDDVSSRKRPLPELESSTTRRTRRQGLIGRWSCPACTFLNETNTWSTACCEMCLQPRPRTGETIHID